MQPNKQDRVWCHGKSWQLRFVMTGSNSSSSILLAMDSLTCKSLFSKWKSKLSYLKGRGFLLWGIHPRPPYILNTPRAESDLADFHCYLYGGLGQGLWQVALPPKSDDSLRSGHCCVPAKMVTPTRGGYVICPAGQVEELGPEPNICGSKASDFPSQISRVNYTENHGALWTPTPTFFPPLAELSLPC